ncbi:DUF998 domain-containing protein [Kribbella sandramycini]|uniref:DUF998 domain-containing protein n=1 Tax=Kribbella sandramycini TaxID=60450 RepID=A0A7Y4NYX2_9ACTN|nr:DUF998 domain-containing protein [Kribbella sandramycini]MBB6567815.1 hypothetical protein [Kribbella sandramycini]NOL39590.1 DUF998 domain-containing protein [Kribbella sandramycini]
MTATASTPASTVERTPDTRRLLGALVLSSPLWAAVSLAQVATRDGFDLTRHPLSMLATGSLAWLQITNFVVAGLLAVVGARGLARVVPSKWVPRLVTTYGVGYVLAGVFTLDPGGGFPVDHPETPTTLSWHAGLHLLAGSVAFIALMIVLISFGRFFLRHGRRGWAIAAFAGAAAVLVGDVASMAQVAAGSLVMAVGVLSAMLLLSVITAKLRSEI